MIDYYLRIEAVNLDYSIYDTHDISTIRGGSFMLHCAFKDISLENSEIIDLGSAASVGLFKAKLLDDSNPTEIACKIVHEIEEKVPFGTFVYAISPVSFQKSFSHQIQELTAECRLQQYQSLSFILPDEKNSNTFCQFDGLRPAVNIVMKGNEPKNISNEVLIRQQRGKTLRNKLFTSLSNTSDLLDSSILDFESPFVNDLESLTKHPSAGKLDGKMAFIYIDGNRFGKIRDKLCTTEENYLEFQRKIQDDLRFPAFKNIIRSAQNSVNDSFLVKTNNNKNQIRLETLLWGGDEIEWVVPSWQALNVLEIFFNSTSRNEFFHNINLTHSVGVVFCHHNVPILQIRHYAHRLCDLAKQDITSEVDAINNDDNRIAFLNMTSFDMISGDIISFLEDYYGPISAKSMIIKSNEITKLKNNLSIIKRIFPRNKVYEIISALKENDENKINEILNRVYSLIGSSVKGHINSPVFSLQGHHNSPVRGHYNSPVFQN